MKPTPEQIAELAREVRGAGFDVYGPLVKEYVHNPIELAKLVELALERFGAGDGEPARGVVIRDGLPTLLSDRDIKTSDTRLYIHPSPTDLRAEYERGLEDAAKVADAKALTWRVKPVPLLGYSAELEECAEKIRALKGKQ